MAILILTDTATTQPPYYVMARDSRTGKTIYHYRDFDDVGKVMAFADMLRDAFADRESLPEPADGFVWREQR